MLHRPPSGPPRPGFLLMLAHKFFHFLHFLAHFAIRFRHYQDKSTDASEKINPWCGWSAISRVQTPNEHAASLSILDESQCMLLREFHILLWVFGMLLWVIISSMLFWVINMLYEIIRMLLWVIAMLLLNSSEVNPSARLPLIYIINPVDEQRRCRAVFKVKKTTHVRICQQYCCRFTCQFNSKQRIASSFIDNRLRRVTVVVTLGSIYTALSNFLNF